MQMLELTTKVSKSAFLVLLILILFSFKSNAQDKATLSGYIVDASNGESLIGAAIFVKELNTGTISNEYGFYSISLEKGQYTFEYSYLGYKTVTRVIDLDNNKTVKIELQENTAVLDEVVIQGVKGNEQITNTEMSTNKLDISTIEKMPAFLGEVDIIKSIQLLPGVNSVGEGSSGFNVRGGSIDQNLVLLDESPVYNSSHLLGFFSVFNPDAVKDVKLYKGGIPARYGGRLSSILDVRMKEGNNKHFNISGGVGTIFSRLAIEGPIKKDKASFIIAARRSYIDVLARPFLKDQGDVVLNFYDITLKTNVNINSKNRLFFSGYLGRDNFGFGNDAGFNWGNSTATVRWNHIFNDKLFSNFTAFYSNYNYELKFGEDELDKFDWDAKIINYSLKNDFTYFLNDKTSLTFGGQTIFYQFEPGNAVGISDGEQLDFSLNKKNAIETGVFLELKQKVHPRLTLNYGIRTSMFNYMGPGTVYEYKLTEPGKRKELVSETELNKYKNIQTYVRPEPRFAATYLINESTSIKVNYNRTIQYIHLISNTSASTPIDVWTPSTNNIKPQEANQVGLGFFKNFKDDTYSLTAETYYKQYKNLQIYIEGADLFLNERVEADILGGNGRAYGLEILAEKKKGRFTGWISYTLARSERQVEGISNGDFFPSRFDQTHNLSTTLFYNFKKRWSIAGNFVINSGTPITFPTNRIEVQGYVIPYNTTESRNNFRIPAYHRLDVSATLHSKENPDKIWSWKFVFGVYNLYNRKNPFATYFRQQEIRPAIGDPVTTEAIRYSVIGSVVPAVSFNFNIDAKRKKPIENN